MRRWLMVTLFRGIWLLANDRERVTLRHCVDLFVQTRWGWMPLGRIERFDPTLTGPASEE